MFVAGVRTGDKIALQIIAFRLSIWVASHSAHRYKASSLEHHSSAVLPLRPVCVMVASPARSERSAAW